MKVLMMTNNAIVYVLLTVIAMLVAIMIGGGFVINHLNGKLDIANTNLGVVAAMSQQQEVKVVESKKIEERVQVVTQDKIKFVKEYVYDANKTDCANAIDSMRNTF